MIDLCLLIVCFQETLPEEAAGHNPLLPAVPQQDETSPTSKVIFTLSSSSSTRDVSQRSNLMRGRKSNCCQPLHSSALMIAPPSFMRRVNPCGNSYHQRRYNQLLSLFSWTWGGTWSLAGRRGLPLRWQNMRASISLESNPDPSTCRPPRLFLNCRASTEALQQRCKASSSLSILS